MDHLRRTWPEACRRVARISGRTRDPDSYRVGVEVTRLHRRAVAVCRRTDHVVRLLASTALRHGQVTSVDRRQEEAATTVIMTMTSRAGVATATNHRPLVPTHAQMTMVT